MWETGTSFAFGAPVNSTNEQNTYSTPFVFRSDLSFSVMCLPLSMRHCRCRLLPNQPAGLKPRRRKWLNQAGRFAGGDQFGHTIPGDGARYEPVGSPSYVHEKVAHFGGRSHNRCEIRSHVANARPLPQNAYPM